MDEFDGVRSWFDYLGMEIESCRGVASRQTLPMMFNVRRVVGPGLARLPGMALATAYATCNGKFSAPPKLEHRPQESPKSPPPT